MLWFERDFDFEPAALVAGDSSVKLATLVERGANGARSKIS